MMPDFDQSAFEKLRDKVLADIAGAMGAFMAFIGDQTGVYKALERRGRCRPRSDVKNAVDASFQSLRVKPATGAMPPGRGAAAQAFVC